MTQTELVLHSLKQIFTVSQRRDGVSVRTQCLYPSNQFIQITVRGGENTFVVSDERGAVREIESAGASLVKEDRLITPVVKPLGLSVSKGAISLSTDAKSLGIAVALVANASKTVAEYLYAHLKIRPTENFKETVYTYLRQKYQNTIIEDTIVGKSNKAYKFDNVIVISDRKRLLIDPVINDRSSIYARVVANIDLKQANHADIEQRIVYDDREQWKSEDLNLLQAGASVFPYSKASDVLSRLAHVS